MLARNDDYENEGDKIYRQTCEVHSAISKRLDGLWDDLALIDQVEHKAAVLGTMTALMHSALFYNMMTVAFEMVFDKKDGNLMCDRVAFARLARDCFDDNESKFAPESGGSPTTKKG